MGRLRTAGGALHRTTTLQCGVPRIKGRATHGGVFVFAREQRASHQSVFRCRVQVGNKLHGAYKPEDEQVLEALASQAEVCFENYAAQVP